MQIVVFLSEGGFGAQAAEQEECPHLLPPNRIILMPSLVGLDMQIMTTSAEAVVIFR